MKMGKLGPDGDKTKVGVESSRSQKYAKTFA